MPLSEFLLETTKSKPGTAQSKMPIPNSSSSDPFSISDHEFAELLWENGQIVLHGHSGRPSKKSWAAASAADHPEKAPAKDNADSANAKNDQLGADLPAHHEDDMVPWINFRIDDESLDADPVHNDFYSEFLEDIGLLGQEAKSPQHAPQEIPSKAAPPAASEFGRVNKPNQLIQLSQNCQSAVTNNNSRVSELGNGGGSSGGKAPMGSCMELVKNTRLAPKANTGVNFVNFPLFSRPHALKINDRVRIEEKAPAAPVHSDLVKSSSGVKGVAGILAQPRKFELEKPDASRCQHVKVPIERIEATCKRVEDHETEKDDKNAAAVKDCSFTKPETEKGPEAVLASSSVCSVNSAGIESYEPKNNREKRKVSEREESSGEQSDDLEDESVGTKKPANGRGTGTKRSRAAEVHNLSERRRRDRINEKMRALQELIPNCNKTCLKTDKASMLEEAIEYLKTLQLQLQMMSMRNGMYLPTPMMLPPGMQHINGPAMAHFSPMGVGMGMGMGGMGMGYGMHMNGSPGCSLIPMQPMHGQQFPCPPIAGPAALHQMMLGPGNPPVFGAIAPHQLSSSPCPVVKGNVAPDVTVPAAAPAPPTSDPAAAAPVSKDRKQEGQNL